MKIRIKYSKRGVMKVIGHLDIMRYFQKAMRRAEVDICYSGGFSPHQIISFAAPLGVGLVSMGEYLDIEVNSTDSSASMVSRLNQAMAEGIEVLSFKKLPDNAKNAMSIVAAADYTLFFREGSEPANKEEWMDGLDRFLAKPSIPFIKKTKKGEKEIDIKPLIYQYKVGSDSIFLQLSAGSTDNLKPEMVIDACCQHNHSELAPFALQIRRDEIYAKLVTNGDEVLVSLEQLGEEIE